MTSHDEREREQRATIRSLFQDLPSQEFESYHSELKAISGLFFEELAHELGPAFNAELERKPHDELDEKRAVASWANYILRNLRLAITCPKTGKPATMVADWADVNNDKSRFRLDVRDDRGKSTKTLTAYRLPIFKLREDRPRQQSSGRFLVPTDGGPGHDERERERRATIRSLFQGLPTEDFESYHAELKAISALFFEELAREFEPAFNADLERRPHQDLNEKQAVVSWANHVLRDLRLAITCPKTGEPATLLADWADVDNDMSRFRLDVRDDRGKSTKTLTSHHLPILKLREDRPRQQGSGRFRRPTDDGAVR